jgi:hypothetical protein
MDVTDDHQPAAGRHPLDKRDKGASKPASVGPSRKAPSNPQADPRHASSPDLLHTAEKDINQTAPAGQTKRRSAPSRRVRPAAARSGAEKTKAETAAAPTVSNSSSPQPSPPLPASTARQSKRRRKVNDDSMDRTRYVPAGPSPSPGGSLQRPMPLHSLAASQFGPRITPKTGRVSKAKKGLPVHVCNICRPPKVWMPLMTCSSRAHLHCLPVSLCVRVLTERMTDLHSSRASKVSFIPAQLQAHTDL